jgi:L-arabinonolactonase
MPETLTADLLVDSRCVLAEGIQWHSGHRRLYWTDIHGRALWSCDADGGAARKIEVDRRVGSFAFTPDDRMLLATEDGLATFDPEIGTTVPIQAVEPDLPATRMNDGRADRQGRFVFGGIDERALSPIAGVYRFDGDRVERLFGGVRCANSIAFSPDGSWMNVADTPTRRIDRIAYGEDGTLGAREAFVTCADDTGAPDGSCVDADGALWNARFGGARVQRILPDGTDDVRIDLPVSQVTCACFGGPHLDRLYITTGREGFTEHQAAAEPQAGGIFVADVGTVGLPESRFGQSVGG